jgi:hypothetical protein
MGMKSLGLTLLVLLYWGLHQDIWLWREARPMTFGFLPAGLAYHAAYTIGIALLMFLLVKTAWPSDLEREVDRSDD